MATPQLSPGVLVREVDLTVGRADNVLDNIGAIAGPFAIGPIEEPIDISTEQELIDTFGEPKSKDGQYEYWMSASSYLSYGGVLKVVRASGTSLVNANAGVGSTSDTDLQIKNYDSYDVEETETADYIYAAKNPGEWANNLKVCTIDAQADQIVGINTSDPAGVSVSIGSTIKVLRNNITEAGVGVTTSFTGYITATVTGIDTTTSSGTTFLDLKITSRETIQGTLISKIDYARGADLSSFKVTDSLILPNDTLISADTVKDWYDDQTLGLDNSTVYWKSLAPKPGTSLHSLDRSGKNDEIHVVVVDDSGSITGIQGNILEKFLGLSKAKDAVSNVAAPQKIYYKNYLADFSKYIFAGRNAAYGTDTQWKTDPSTTDHIFNSEGGNGAWGQNAQGIIFNAIGAATYKFSGGADYGANGGMTATLADLITAYGKFGNSDEIEVDYLIYGPSCATEDESKAKANYLISLAEARKDCIAVVSPHKGNVVGQTNAATQTTNVVNFFSGVSSIASSSYAVFDSGYKYTFDRFNNVFRWVACNADVAGLMARTSLTAYPWFSPAGQQRGILNNAVKLAYNPNKAQRDQLYEQRINSIVNQPGIGVLLFGDKTALGYASAFDRINVRRLFLTIEQSLQRSAEAQLFELNDQITRANFINIVEPYLRDVQAKRGLYDFLVICDETNNTPDVVDNNEFRADIFLKPTKSINYVTLTFVATRTGISFEEVAGRV